jgi:hypothetical protein
MRIVIGIVLATSLLGCKASAPPVIDGIRITRNAADVERCKTIGAVQSIPPYAFAGDNLKEIRSRGVAVGADTVLLNVSRTATTSGIAYRCHVERSG